jgi:hypothetical protein
MRLCVAQYPQHYIVLHANGRAMRGPETPRHTFLSVQLDNDNNVIKEKHFYFR